MGFGDRLKKARELSGMTGEELGKALAVATERKAGDISKQAISNWEKGRNFPNPAQIAALCTLLRVSADHLICGVESIRSQKALHLAALYDSMPAPKQVRLLRLAEIAFDANPGEYGDEGWIEEVSGGLGRESQPRFLK